MCGGGVNASLDGSDESALAALERHIRAVAGANSEAELLRAAGTAVSQFAWGAQVRLVSCEASFRFARRMVFFSGREGPPDLRAALAPPTVEGWLAAGQVRTLSAEDIAGLGALLPSGSTRAVFVPCAEREAQSGLILSWEGEGPGPVAADWQVVRCLAGVVGVSFGRLAALMQAGALRGGIENRVRNLIAVIRSMGGRSAERAASLENFMLHFEGRIDALARSQIALTRGGDVSLADILREELVAQQIQDGEDVRIEGEHVSLTMDQAEALGLAVHELAVNAVKFGAFADKGGRLDVSWRTDRPESAAGRVLTIEWSELAPNGAGVDAPEREGFGLMVLRKAVPFQIGGETDLDFAPRGLNCRITFPLGE